MTQNTQDPLRDMPEDAVQSTGTDDSEPESCAPETVEQKSSAQLPKQQAGKASAKKPRSRGVVYLTLVLVGVLLIGFGCGISVFELAGYQSADYSAETADTLPAIETSVSRFVAKVESGRPFQLDIFAWYLSDCDVLIDDSLTDTVKIEITAPKNLYNFQLEHYTNEQYSYYGIVSNFNDFEEMKLALQLARDKYLLTSMPRPKVVLTMNQEQAKSFVPNRMQNAAADIPDDYAAQMEQMERDYNDQLAQKDADIAELQRQLEDATAQLENIRNSLN